jgi:hypothetical protein
MHDDGDAAVAEALVTIAEIEADAEGEYRRYVHDPYFPPFLLGVRFDRWQRWRRIYATVERLATQRGEMKGNGRTGS